MLEVTSTKEVVWKYICPVAATGPMTQGQAIPIDAARSAELMNSVFRVYRYAKDYAAFTDRTLTPGNTIEKSSSTGVNNNQQLLPAFELFQNYPNPFNPSTVIKYQVPSTGNVTLKIFDVLGREMATLVNEEKAAGDYNVTFDASHLERSREMASGIYFYKLQEGNFVQTKKMLLIK